MTKAHLTSSLIGMLFDMMRGILRGTQCVYRKDGERGEEMGRERVAN